MLANVKSHIRSLKHAYLILFFYCILFVLKIHILGLSTYHQLVLVACAHNLKIIGTLVNFKFHHSFGHNLLVSLLFCLTLPRIHFKEVLLPYGSNSLCSFIVNLNKAKPKARCVTTCFLNCVQIYKNTLVWVCRPAYGFLFTPLTLISFFLEPIHHLSSL